ncbi:ABC transporter permease [Pedobacter frigoris]|uniref:ABC transporter permease n=1 Tax=Pedobacter frigoris TaxID=2571272 RepID=A0A4U1CL84_9SPHI|nr:ABC transporter permease [Pedobacter frigoris]TKC07622.1 ABC transporter permease [Pedobacter frigoris]
MHALLISLKSEFYKSRKTLAFWAAILLPLLICSLIAFGFFSQSARMSKVHYPAEALWMMYSGSALSVMGMLILPFYVIFMAFSVNNIEHKNDTWKTLFAQPLNKFSIYAAKYLYAVLLIFICLSLFVLLTYLSGNLLHLLVKGYNFNEVNPLGLLSKVYLKLFLSSLGILSLQFIASLIWSDFLKPMGIGFIGIIAGIITATKGWEYAYLIPYSHPAMVLTATKGKEPQVFFTQEIYSSLVYAAIFFILGYFIVARKSMK